MRKREALFATNPPQGHYKLIRQDVSTVAGRQIDHQRKGRVCNRPRVTSRALSLLMIFLSCLSMSQWAGRLITGLLSERRMLRRDTAPVLHMVVLMVVEINHCDFF